jgi:DNA-binding NarL/FixJ family response regulator
MIQEAATNESTKKSVLICDTQPVAVEGMKWLIENSGDLRFAGSVPTLNSVYQWLRPDGAAAGAANEAASAELCNKGADEALAGSEVVAPRPIDAIVVDKGFGLVAVMDLLRALTATSHPSSVIVWGSAISESEALRLLQAGARGILRRSSDSDTLLTCLRAVTCGGTWMEDGIFGSTEKLFNPRRSQLTQRENEVVVLVEKGLRNRDIARILGIQTGTVKIHLKHIFEKTGVRGRYGLAFTGLQNKGAFTISTPPQFIA